MSLAEPCIPSANSARSCHHPHFPRPLSRLSAQYNAWYKRSISVICLDENTLARSQRVLCECGVCTYVYVHRIWLLAEDTSYSYQSSHQTTACQCLWGHHTYWHQILMLLNKKIFFRNQLIQVNSVNGTLWKLLYLRAAPWVWDSGGTWKMEGKQPAAGCWRTEEGHLTVDIWLWIFYTKTLKVISSW